MILNSLRSLAVFQSSVSGFVQIRSIQTKSLGIGVRIRRVRMGDLPNEYKGMSPQSICRHRKQYYENVP